MDQQKKQDAASQQWASYQDILNQTLSWINQMEANLAPEHSSWSSIQEIRPKLLKLKVFILIRIFF